MLHFRLVAFIIVLTCLFTDYVFVQGVCKLTKKLAENANDNNAYRRIDIRYEQLVHERDRNALSCSCFRLIPCDQYFCSLLYFTGSDLFNKRMRSIALEKGFTINEYSIRPLGSTGIVQRFVL